MPGPGVGQSGHRRRHPARGAGQDAAIDLLVALNEPMTASQVEAGNVDFRDRGALPVVEASTPLAALRPAVPGKPGRNVMGQVVKPPAARMLRLQSGRNVNLEDNGRVVVAAAKGILNRPELEKFEVLDVLEIKGDVDFKVGHVNFPGLVRVMGAVLPDFRVRAHSSGGGGPGAPQPRGADRRP